MSPVKTIINSVKEFKKIHTLVTLALLIALCVVLGMFANFTIMGGFVKIKFTFIPIAIAGAMYGPIASILVGALGDILAIMLVPNGIPNPGITLCAAITGAVCGFVLYKNRFTLPRVIIAWVLKSLLAESFLKAFWLYPLYGVEYPVALFWCAVQLAIMCVPEILLVYYVGKLAVRLDNRLNKK